MSKSLEHVDIADILQLVEVLPINNKLEVEIDELVPLEKENSEIVKRLGIDANTIRFMDIVKLLISFIKGAYPTNTEKKPYEKLYEIQKIGYNYPTQYLLFDFCLAALAGDLLDAKLYLGHALNIIGLSNQLNLLLSAIVYTPLTSYKEVRELLALLALEVQPANVESFIELYGEEFQNRYRIYQNEIMRIDF